MATMSQAQVGTELQELARKHLWMHFSRMGGYDAEHEIPIITRAEGCYVYDEHGKRYLDGLSGLFCVNAGHGRREYGEAAARQVEELGLSNRLGRHLRGALEPAVGLIAEAERHRAAAGLGQGVGGLSQPHIAPGETYAYEFTLRQHGTLMYHPHFDEMVQIAMGMTGFLVVHPRRPEAEPVDRDFALMLGEWFVKPGSSTPDPMKMSEFNLLTFNSRAYPGTSPLVVRRGDRVRIRLANLGPMDGHPIHIHGHALRVTATDGGPVPATARYPETTVWVPVGATRDLEFVADNPGDWPFHCHITHHAMNQMGHDVPNLLGIRSEGLGAALARTAPGAMLMGETGMGGMMEMGAPRNSIPMRSAAGPFGPIDMGGMFTVVKVREHLEGDGDPGWYAHPRGTVAERVD